MARLYLSDKLAKGHLLGHEQNSPAIVLVCFTQEPAKLAEKPRILARTAPSDFVRRPSLEQIRQQRRIFAVVEELAEWAL